jgi:hypothetical protein
MQSSNPQLLFSFGPPLCTLCLSRLNQDRGTEKHALGAENLMGGAQAFARVHDADMPGPAARYHNARAKVTYPTRTATRDPDDDRERRPRTVTLNRRA